MDDLVLPRTAHVAFVRTPHAHARIVDRVVDATTRARGVLAVLTGPDVARLCRPYRGIRVAAISARTWPGSRWRWDRRLTS